MRPIVITLSVVVFFSNSSMSQVTFTDVSSIAGTGLGEGTARGFSWTDFNKDSFPDLFIPTAGAIPNKLYRNNGNGTFSDVAAVVGLNDVANTITCSWADFDNDGDPDLLTTATAAPVKLWRNNFASGVDSSFTDITATSGISMSGAQMPAWADYNRDGRVDCYIPISNSAASTDALFRNNGSGTFSNLADSAGVNHQTSGVLEQAIHWGDFNKDGFPDLFIGNLQTGGPSFLHRNNGDGTFSEVAGTLGFQGSARGSQWVDFNNDGLWDFSVAGYAGTTAMPVKLFKNNGNGTFTDVAGSIGISDAVISWGLTWADIDNNGYEDLFVAVSGQSTSCVLYQNNGNGTFTNITTQAGLGGLVQLSAAWADYDRDGDMDLYSAGAASAGNHLFRNNSDTTRTWLSVNLTGLATNEGGVGAQIEVHADSLHMMREVNTAIGYRSQNIRTAHFGLGNRLHADSVVVRWPAGAGSITRSVLTHVPVNQVINIVQQSSTAVVSTGARPAMFKLYQNYPNPFNPLTTIAYEMQVQQRVKLQVLDVLGREVATLIDGVESAGKHSATWNAENFASGVYFYQLRTEAELQRRKMILIR